MIDRLRSTRRLPVLAVWVVVIASELFMPVDGFWTTDNAVRFVQVQGFVRDGLGDPFIHWLGSDVDPTFAFVPYIPPVGHVAEGRLYAGFVPFYPMLASVPFAAFGTVGIRLLGHAFLLALLLGVWALSDAVSAPGRMRRIAPPLSVVLVGLATPVWFYALTFWEHVPAAALVVWACWFGVLAARTGSLLAAAGAGALAAAAIYLRDVLLLMSLVAFVVLLFAAARRGVPLVFGCVALLVLVPLVSFNLHYFGAPLGLHSQPDSPFEIGWSAHIADRGGVTWRLLFALHERPWVSLLVVGPLLALMVRRPRLTSAQLRLALPGLVALLSCVALVVLAGFVGSASPLTRLIETNGLFAAAPLIALAFVARRSPQGWCAAAERGLWLLSIGYVAAYVVLAPLRLSTGLHWGCRYLLEVTPILGVLAGGMLARLWQLRPRWAARSLLAVGLASSIGLQLYSLDLQRKRRVFSAEINRVVAQSDARAVLTDSWFVPQELAHVFFEKPIFLRGRGDVGALRRALLAHGYEKVLFVAPPPPEAEARGIRVVRDGLGFGELGFGIMRAAE